MRFKVFAAHTLLCLLIVLPVAAHAEPGPCTRAFLPYVNPLKNITEDLFKKKSDELTPDELAKVSENAQAMDDPMHPTNVSSDRQALRILKSLRLESKQTELKLQGSKIDPKQFHPGVPADLANLPRYEVIVVGGAGIQGSIFESTFQAYAPGGKMLCIDAGDGSNRTFDSDFFHLNSSETPEKGDTPLLYGPVQLRHIMPDFTGHVYPLARRLGSASHYSSESVRADWLLKNRLLDAIKVNDEFVITTSQGYRAVARKLIVGPGYGPIKDQFFDEPSRTFIRESTEAYWKTGDLRGKAISFDDLKAFEEAVTRNQKDQIRGTRKNLPSLSQFDSQIQNLDAIIVGGNDGGSVVAERISRKSTRAKRYWFGQEGATGEEFVAALENKKRYADLLDEVRSGEIVVLDQHVVSFRPVTHPDGQPGVLSVHKRPDGTLGEVITHYAVLAPGYQEAPMESLNGMIPNYFANDYDPELPAVWEMTKTREEKFKQEHPELALNATPGLYSIGVNAGKASGLLSVLRGGGLTVQVAKAAAHDVQILDPVTPITATPGASAHKTVRLKPEFSASIAVPKIALASLRMQILKVSRDFVFGASLDLSMRFSGSRLQLSVSGLESTAAAQFLDHLAQDRDFLRFANDYQKRQEVLVFQVPVTTAGGLRMDQAQIRFQPE